MRHELGLGGLLSSKRGTLSRYSLLAVIPADTMIDQSVLRRERPRDTAT